MKKMIWKLARHNSEEEEEGLFMSEHMMTEIFLWLPLKSLVRLNILSKRWYFLISHKDFYFRRNYLSNHPPIMIGFFYQMPESYRFYDRVRFLPTITTSTQQQQQQLQKYNINVQYRFSSLDESLDKFLSLLCCLDHHHHHRDQDSSHAHAHAHNKKITIAGSSNGFLLCSLESMYVETYYLINPVTMEWVALPKPQTIVPNVLVGFVCKGDYPCLDLVEYTILRIYCVERDSNLLYTKLLFQVFSSGDNQWREYICPSEYLMRFTFPRQHIPVIVSTTTTNSDDQGSSSGGGMVVYSLVMLEPSMAIAILVINLNRGGDNSLQMIQTPGPDRGSTVLQCADYIREFDNGRVIHYVRIFYCMDFEFWVLNTETKEWCLKHRASLKTMMEGYRWTDVRKWNGAGHFPQTNEAVVLYHIHAFHPMNPSLIFLTLYGRMVCYNVETGKLDLVYDFSKANMLQDYCNYVYQWPCWPPLL